jgi:hypothetical protein
MRTFNLNALNGRPLANCVVVEIDSECSLMSYNTKVVTYNIKTKEMNVIKTHSNTTCKHINAFLKFYGFPSCSKKEIKEYYNAE